MAEHFTHGRLTRLNKVLFAGQKGGQASKKRKRGQTEAGSGLQLSLRPSHGAWRKAATPAPAGATSAPETLDVGRLKKGQQVRCCVSPIVRARGSCTTMISMNTGLEVISKSAAHLVHNMDLLLLVLLQQVSATREALPKFSFVFTLDRKRSPSILSLGLRRHQRIACSFQGVKVEVRMHTLQVSAYVKSVSSAGVFVVLARNAEARVKMGHLSDSFVKNPKEAFPEGKLVEGRVISAADGRCDPYSCLPQASAFRYGL